MSLVDHGYGDWLFLVRGPRRGTVQRHRAVLLEVDWYGRWLTDYLDRPREMFAPPDPDHRHTVLRYRDNSRYGRA